jgi:hypothetical protein
MSSSRMIEIMAANKFKVFHYVPHDAGQSKMIILTRQQIVDKWYDTWVDLLKELGREHLLYHMSKLNREERCVHDWVILNYAIPIFDEDE